MTNIDNVILRKIHLEFENCGEKKLLKKIIKDFNLKKTIFLYYSKNKPVPICALPEINLILTSKKSFIAFIYNFYFFLKDKGYTLDICESNVNYVAKLVISHEIGHILDNSILNSRIEHATILSTLSSKLSEYNINIHDENIHKLNLPQDIEDEVLNLKKNLIQREAIAWDKAKKLVNINTPSEEFLYQKIKEYALSTYNFGNIKTIIKDNKLDTFMKLKKSLLL